MILDAEDAGLLTQVKDDKAKSDEQSRRNAIRVRLLLDYGCARISFISVFASPSVKLTVSPL